MTAQDLPLPPALAVDEPPLSDEFLERFDAAGENEPPAEIRGWEIVDDGAAQWAMAHVASIDTDLRQLSEQRDDWQARIDHWFHQRADVVLRRRAFFQAHLIAYAAARREADPKAPKTLALPSGRVTSSDRAPVVKVVDDAALAVWLLLHGLGVGPDGADLAVTTTKVYAVPLRKVLVTDGESVVVAATGEKLAELPPGLDIEPAHTTYDVKT